MYFNLGLVLCQLGHDDEAVTSYRRAIQINPGLAVADFNLGALLEKKNSRLTGRSSTTAKPSWSSRVFFEAYGAIGTALQQQGHLNDAIAYYRQSLAISDHAQGHFNLAPALRDQGNMGNAVTCYLQALRMKPGDQEASSNMAQFLYDAGRFIEAIPYFEDPHQEDW